MTAVQHDYKNGLDLRRSVAETPPRGRTPVKVQCPYHDDQIATGCVYPDGYNCPACGANVGPLQFLATLKGLDLVTEAAAVRAIADALCELGPAEQRATPQPVTEALAAKVEAWHDALTTNAYSERRDYWYRRGFAADTIVAARLGHTGRAYVLPLYDIHGQLFSVKYRRDDALDPHAPKYWTHPGTGRTAVYYPPVFRWKLFPEGMRQEPFNKPVVLCEGELDALLLAQHGVPAVSVNNGVNAVAAMLPELLERHGGLVLCLDNDEPGVDVSCATLADESLDAYEIQPTAFDPRWGKDVGEAFSSGHGEALLDALRAAYRIVATQRKGN